MVKRFSVVASVALLGVSSLAPQAAAQTTRWEWKPSARATGYEFCWSNDPSAFSDGRAICVDVGNQTWHEFEPGGEIVFVSVRAYNHDGSSDF